MSEVIAVAAHPQSGHLSLVGELTRDPMGIVRINDQPIDFLLAAALPAGEKKIVHLQIEVYASAEDGRSESEDLGLS